MASTAAWASTPRAIDRATVSAANTNRDGSGTIVEVAQGSAAGFRINRVIAQATVSTTPGMIRLYLSKNSGTNWYLFDEIPVSAVTVGAGVPGFRGEVVYEDLILYGTTMRLGASTHNAESHEVWAPGADI